MKYVLLLAIAMITMWSCEVARAVEVTLIAPGGTGQRPFSIPMLRVARAPA
jgi:hypothetical protein